MRFLSRTQTGESSPKLLTHRGAGEMKVLNVNYWILEMHHQLKIFVVF